jgi:hypothetical protein
MVNEEQATPEGHEGEDPRTPFEEFLYHQRRALEETGKALEALLPEGFRAHGSEASKEFTKGLRVLVDAAMDELKRANEKSQEAAQQADQDSGSSGRASTTGKTKVKVEVD